MSINWAVKQANNILVSGTSNEGAFYERLFKRSRTFEFTSFSTVFQSYQDDGMVIEHACAQLNPVHVRKFSASS